MSRKTYVEPDPMVEQLSHLIKGSHLTDIAIAEKVSAARHAKMSASTVSKLRLLQVSKPQNYTIDWVGFALGLRRKWVAK